MSKRIRIQEPTGIDLLARSIVEQMDPMAIVWKAEYRRVPKYLSIDNCSQYQVGYFSTLEKAVTFLSQYYPSDFHTVDKNLNLNFHVVDGNIGQIKFYHRLDVDQLKKDVTADLFQYKCCVLNITHYTYTLGSDETYQIKKIEIH